MKKNEKKKKKKKEEFDKISFELYLNGFLWQGKSQKKEKILIKIKS